MDCFENIIGITETTCECFTEEFSDAARKSNSGLYMDQLEESPSLEAYRTKADCGLTLEQVLSQARKNAIEEFKKELFRELGSRYTVRQQMYEGAVGQPVGNGYLNIGFDVAGVALEMQPTRGATVEITGIKPMFNYDGDLTVSVYKAVSSGTGYLILSTVRVLELNTSIASPALQAPAEKLVLDATDELGKPLTYLFAYNRTGAIQPANNTTSCGCGNKEVNMHHYVRAHGIAGGDINSLLFSNRTDKVNGLLIYIYARCGTGDFICENYQNNEFIRTSINYAILYKSVAHAITGILNSTVLNRYTMTNRELMQRNVYVMSGKFKKSVAWLAEKMDMRNNDCYACTPGITGTSYDYHLEGIVI